MKRQRRPSVIWFLCFMLFMGFLLWSVSGTKLIIDLPKTVVPANTKATDPIFEPCWDSKAQAKLNHMEVMRLENRMYGLMADLETIVRESKGSQKVSTYSLINLIKHYDTSPNKVYSTSIERGYFAKQ